MPHALRLRWLPLLAGLVGCNGSSSFICEDDVACEGVGPAAQCEANGYCSYEDADCEGGRRYGDLAGDGLAGQCVGNETATSTGSTSTDPTTTTTTSGPSTLDGTTTGVDTLPSDTTDGPEPSDWWDCSWSARRELIIEVPSIGETLTDVPILLVLDSSRIDPSIMAPDGHDLRVVTPDGAIVLAEDIEQWSATELSFAWIRVPQLHEGTNVLFMYYGNPAAPPPPNPAATWNGYAGVWHMGPLLADATGLNELVQGMGETTPGQAALAQHLADYVDGVEVAPPADLGGLFVAGGTITAMIRAASGGGDGEGFVAMRAGSTNGDDGWIFGLDGNRSAMRFARGFNVNRMTWTTPNDSIALHTWHHVAVVYQDDPTAAPTLYIDGIPQRLSDMGNPMGSPSPDDAIPTLQLGSTFNAASAWFDGILDEVRLAQQPRTAGWITVQNASLRDELVSYGPQQSCD